jgi:exo-beta-1,3-glucanase (GH17 family)
MSNTNITRHLDVNLSSLDSTGFNGDRQQLSKKMKEQLLKGIYGLSFSPYLDGQSPSEKSVIKRSQIVERLEIIKPYTKWVRSFSCSYGNELIPEIAKEMGFSTLVGTWIDADEETNEIEISKLIEVAKTGCVDMIAIGNEVLLRKELPASKIIEYINRVKKEVPDIPVTYVDSYYIFKDYPEVTAACDVILANCYPFWEHCDLKYAVSYMKEMYNNTKKIAGNKKVIISETGWPNKGTSLSNAIPSEENAMKYFINTYQWAQEENVDIIYFSSFDEAWKSEDEGECGAYWGLFDKDGDYKY